MRLRFSTIEKFREVDSNELSGFRMLDFGYSSHIMSDPSDNTARAESKADRVSEKAEIKTRAEASKGIEGLTESQTAAKREEMQARLNGLPTGNSETTNRWQLYRIYW